MNENKRLLKNTAIITLGNFSARALSFLMLPVYTDILTAAEFGIYDYLMALGSFLIPVVSLSIYQAMFRYLCDERGTDGTAKVIVHSFLVLVAGSLLFVMLGLAFHSVIKLEFYWLLIFYVISTCSSNFFLSMLRGMGRIGEYAVMACISTFIHLIFNIVAIVFLRIGVMGLMLSLIAAGMVTSAIIMIRTRFFSYLRLQVLDRAFMLDLLKYALPLVPNNVSGNLTYYTSRIIITNSIGAGSNGIYAVANRFPSIVDIIYNNFYAAWCESASRVHGSDGASGYYEDMYHKMQRLMLAAVLAMTAGMPILFRLLISGTEFAAAFQYIHILLIAVYFNTISQYLAGIYVAMKNSKLIAASTLTGAALNVILGILFIPRFGLYAAALISLLTNVVIFLIRRVRIKSYMRWSSDKVFLLTAFPMTALVFLLYSYGNAAMICASILCAGAWGAFINRDILREGFGMLANRLKRKRG